MRTRAAPRDASGVASNTRLEHEGDASVDRAAVLLFAGVIVCSAAFLFYCARDLWFGGDEWFIITDRGLTTGPGHLGLFQPHFEHWSTVPILAFRALYSVFGLRTYWPYIGLTIVVHLAIVVLLWLVMIRARVDAWVATCACAVFAIAGTGFENLTNAWQVQLIAPLALGLAAILVAPASGRRFTPRDGLAALLMSVAMMCSGVALPMLVTVALVLLVRRGWHVALATAAVPAALYGWWYLAYGRHGPRVAKPAPGKIPAFVWNGLTDALGDVARAEAVGVVVVLAVVAWVAYRLVRHGFEPDLTVPLALAIGGVLFLVGTGYRRGNLFGIDPAQSRYAYVTIAFVLPLVARAGQALFRGTHWQRALLVVVTVALVVGQARKLDHQADLARPGKQSDRGAVLATAALAREGRRFLLHRPLSAFEPEVTVDEIVAMDHDGKLPPLDEATTRDFLTVLARLDVVAGARAVIPPRSVAHLDAAFRVTLARDATGCLTARARRGNEIAFRLDGPGTFRVRGDGLLGMHLRDSAHHVDGEVVYVALARGQEQTISATTTDDLLVLTLPDTKPTRLCDVAG
jgi:hypothetical protein